MSEFETSHFKESGQKQEFSAQNRLFQSKVANKVSCFTSKQPILGREDLFMATFSIQTEIYTLFCSKIGSEDDEKFQIHSFCNTKI